MQVTVTAPILDELRNDCITYFNFNRKITLYSLQISSPLMKAEHNWSSFRPRRSMTASESTFLRPRFPRLDNLRASSQGSSLCFLFVVVQAAAVVVEGALLASLASLPVALSSRSMMHLLVWLLYLKNNQINWLTGLQYHIVLTSVLLLGTQGVFNNSRML